MNDSKLLSPEQVAEALARAEKATPGPWRKIRDAQGTCGLMHPTEAGVAVAWLSSAHNPAGGYVGDSEHEIGRPPRQANADFISAARTDVPDLCHTAEHWRREAERLRGLLDQMPQDMDERKVLVPHGIGSAARDIIAEFLAVHDA